MPKSSKTSSPFDRYEKVDGTLKQRLFGASFGPYGSGKTHFWLGAPGPIVVISLDQGLEGVVEKFTDNKEVYVAEYKWQPTEETGQAEAVELRDKIEEDFLHACENARTVIIDKETDLWELFRYAEFGAPKDAPLNYPALNQRYRAFVNVPKALDINVGFVQSLKEAWGKRVNPKTGAQGAAPTGEYVRAGFKELEGLVHVNIGHRWEESEDGAIFHLDIGKCRGPVAQTVQGSHYQNMPFAEIAQIIFPDSSAEDWE